MDDATAIRRLNVIRVVAILDSLLLVPLVVAALSDAESTVSVLGPIHGVGFFALVGLCAWGAAEERWGWWFPALVVGPAHRPCLLGLEVAEFSSMRP